MRLTTLTPPSALLDATDTVLRQALRLFPEETEQDALIDSLCLAAVTWAEGYTRRRFMPQTVRLLRDGFGCIRLPVEPVQSVDQVSYVDGVGETQVLAGSGYRLVTSRQPAELHPPYGETFPTPRPDRDTVTIDLVVGHASADDVPEDIVQAVRLLVVHWYRDREALGSAPEAVAQMLDPWRIWL